MQSFRKRESKRREKERERNIFHLLVHSQNGCNDWSWVNGSQNWRLPPRRGAVIQVLEPSSAPFPDTLVGDRLEVGSWDSPSVSMGWQSYRLQLNLICHNVYLRVRKISWDLLAIHLEAGRNYSTKYAERGFRGKRFSYFCSCSIEFFS